MCVLQKLGLRSLELRARKNRPGGTPTGRCDRYRHDFGHTEAALRALRILRSLR